VQQRHTVRALAEAQPHVRHVEPGRIVLGTEGDGVVDVGVGAGRHRGESRLATVGCGRRVALAEQQDGPHKNGGDCCKREHETAAHRAAIILRAV